jgi:hypothetical protein
MIRALALLTTLLALAGVLVPCGAALGEDENMDKQVVIDKLNIEPAWVSHMGCLIGCAKYLGVDASPSWIYGGCGHAFALNIHNEICPSGPTAWAAEKCDRLAANVGLVVESLSVGRTEKDFADKQAEAWKMVCEAVDAGRPCYGWELGVPEWYVICGYDQDGNYLFRDYGGQIGRKPHAELGTSEIGWLCIDFVTKGKPADDRTTVRDALLFAIEHGAGKHSQEMYRTGPSGYDSWIKALRNTELWAKPDTDGMGQAYNAQCWAECRKNAVAFLEEAKKRVGDQKTDADFDEAVKQYKVVSEALAAVAKAFPFDHMNPSAMTDHVKDAANREKAAKALETARDAERKGLRALAKIAVALGAKDIDPDKVIP